MLGLLRAGKLIVFALIVGFIGIQPGDGPDFTQATGQTPTGPTTPGEDPGFNPIDPGTDPGELPSPDIGPTSGPKPGGGDLPPPVSGLTCDRAGNGGNTDTGVTADKIKLATTVVQSGDGSSFLGDSPVGLNAVVTKINSAGGICGRLLDLDQVDDGWDSQRGLTAIKSFIASGAFALPVVPSSEGLTAAIEAGEITKAGIPVIGTDGMLSQQYENPWVWPVATATVSTMRVIAKHAYGRGARCFGIVWDKRYRFGAEGEKAFTDLVKTMPGAKMCANEGILPGQSSYSNEIRRFNADCNNKCEAVALLLEPLTARTWIDGNPQVGSKVTSGAQTLFQDSFARNCGVKCEGWLMWTGYNPPIENLAALPGVKQYVNDVRRVSPTVDVTNQFLEGAYLGMTIFVEALKAVGPDLTRERLAAVMNSQTFRHDIAQKLKWSQSDRHANCSAQAFRVTVAQGSFVGFANAQTGFIKDPKC